MRTRLLLLGVLAALAIGCGAPKATPETKAPGKPAPADEVVNVRNSDPLRQAVERAKKELPTFEARLAKPREGDRAFAILARFPVGETFENIWVDDLEKTEDGGFTGRIAAVPKVLDKQRGDLVDVARPDVLDWVIVRQDGKHLGNYTSEVLRKLAP